MSKKNIFSYFRSLVRIMKSGNYDIVHSNELFHSGVVLLAAYFAGVKCRIAHSHSIYDLDDINAPRSTIRKIYSSIMRWIILRFSNVQLGCSTPAGEFLFGRKAVKKDTYHLLFNSVDTSEYLKNYNKRETGEFCETEWINVLHVGRVYEVKNQLFIAEIAEEFKNRNKNIRILCAGQGNQEYVDKVQELIKRKDFILFCVLLICSVFIVMFTLFFKKEGNRVIIQQNGTKIMELSLEENGTYVIEDGSYYNKIVIKIQSETEISSEQKVELEKVAELCTNVQFAINGNITELVIAKI